jgi:hypothetical protein
MPLIRCCAVSLLFAGALLAQQGRGRGGVAGNQQAGPPPATDCAISGSVVNALTGEPIPRAMVQGNPGGASTDAKGEWSIGNQRCARWVPTATRPGFLNGAYGTASPGGPRKSIELVSGSAATGIKITMLPESSLSGTVLNSAGDPVESAQVTILRATVVNGYYVLAQGGNGRTDARGNFIVDRLQPGRVIVCASSTEQTFPPGGGAALAYPEECYPAPPSEVPSAAMPLEAGRDTHVALTLRATPPLHVRGVFTGASGTRNVSIALMRAPAPMPRGVGVGMIGGPITARPAMAQADGSFDITNVTPGEYIAVGRLPGGRGVTATASARVTVGNSDVNGVQLVLQSPVAVNGTIRYELAGGSPAASASPSDLADERNPNQNQPVMVNLVPSQPTGGGAGQPKWDDDHLAFSWEGVGPGEYNFYASVRGISGAYVKSATLRGQDVLNQPISIEGPSGPIVVVVSDDSASFRATVTDADGHPAGGSVVLKPAAGATLVARAGDDGSAQLQNVPSGDYSAWAFDDITQVPWNDTEWMRQHAGAPVHITISRTGSAPLTLKRLIAPPQ